MTAFNKTIVDELTKVHEQAIELEQLKTEKEKLVIEQRRAKEMVATSTNELEQTTQQLEHIIDRANKMIVKAEMDNYSKKMFLSNVSHKLRTSLNGILGLTDLILLTGSSTEHAENLKLIKNSASQTIVFLDDVIDYVRLEAHQLKLESVPFNLRELFESVIDIYSYQIEQKQIEFNLYIHKDVPRLLIGDAYRLKRIFMNLIDIMLSYNNDQEITIEVKNNQQTGEQITLEFALRNSISEISKLQYQATLKNFIREKNLSHQKAIGDGLGLFISSTLVDLLNGAKWLCPETLTIHFTANFTRQDRQFYNQEISLRDRDILIVDSHEMSTAIMSDFLNSYDAHVQIAHDVTQALDYLSLNLPHIIIFNYRPDTTEWLNSIYRQIQSQNIFIVVLAFNQQQSQLNQFKNVWLVNKPLKENEFLEILLKTDGKTNPHQIETELSKLKDKVKILLVDDNLVNQKVAASLITKLGLSIDTVADGIQACEAVQTQNYDLVFMDVLMPNMDGITATRKIRSEARFKNLPIIALTANILSEDKYKYKAAGMNDIITKPIEPKEFYQAMYRWLIKSK